MSRCLDSRCLGSRSCLGVWRVSDSVRELGVSWWRRGRGGLLLSGGSGRLRRPPRTCGVKFCSATCSHAGTKHGVWTSTSDGEISVSLNTKAVKPGTVYRKRLEGSVRVVASRGPNTRIQPTILCFWPPGWQAHPGRPRRNRQNGAGCPFARLGLHLGLRDRKRHHLL